MELILVVYLVIGGVIAAGSHDGIIKIKDDCYKNTILFEKKANEAELAFVNKKIAEMEKKDTNKGNAK